MFVLALTVSPIACGAQLRRLFEQRGMYGARAEIHGARISRSASETLQQLALLQDHKLQRTVCETYAQDYACLGYPLPRACWTHVQPLVPSTR
jgi:hypothetical protein